MQKLNQIQWGTLSLTQQGFQKRLKVKPALGKVFRQILNFKNRIFSSVIQNILPNFNLDFIAPAGHLSSISKRVGALFTCVAPAGRESKGTTLNRGQWLRA